ncbi:hypothetical protein DFH09DRAFT_1269163 [Mycena vulgaris]|nr:hypothetical protein DFH09DRAFT_1269163 [Mycena vulgaris]
MSDNSLPDEIISEILSPALKVSDEVFSDTSDVSPFAQYAESTSSYLLVCKSWLRVATPLLYNVVILRSKAQAKALGQILDKNKDLGQFIKKLRVEGGYRAPMGVILQSSPNISDLFISFEIWSADNTGGLCKGLSFINPTRLIIRDLDYKWLKNKMAVNLEDALAKAILEKWDHLTICDLPYVGGGAVNGRVSKIFNALATSRRLKTVAIPCRGAPWAHSALKDCPLQVIQLKPPIVDYYLAQLHLDDNPALKALVRFKEDPFVATHDSHRISGSELPDIAPSLNPFFTPLSAASPEVRETIWKRILYFAMSVLERAHNLGQKNLAPRMPLLLVSKTVNQLALPYFYTHTVVNNSTNTSKLLTVLRNNPSLGPDIRSICEVIDVSAFDPFLRLDQPDNESMLAVLSRTTALVRLRGSAAKDLKRRYMGRETMISWECFEAAARCSGSTLREFSKPVATRHHASPAVLDNFTALRSLDWKCDTIFNCKSEDARYDGFSNLEDLQIWSLDPSFLTVLSMMKLNSLRRLVLSYNVGDPAVKFLKTHGNKLTELHTTYEVVEQLKVNIFEVCSNLSSIELRSFNTPPDAVHFTSPGPSLAKINLTLDVPGHVLPHSLPDTRSFGFTDRSITFPCGNCSSMAFSTNYSPACARLQSPVSSGQRATKCCWVTWAETMLEHNINLTDKSGKKWRRRLKAK